MKNKHENTDENIRYFQPSFFDTFPEIFNEETCKLIETEDEDMLFWAIDTSEEFLNEEYDHSDNNKAAGMESLNSGLQVDTGDEKIELLQDFAFFDWAGKQEFMTGAEEVIQEIERID